MTTSLTLLSLGCILAYTFSVCIKFKGIPNSISASFYSLEHKWWFRFTMWLTPILLLPAILEISKPNTEFLAFLALVGMIIVGCFPDYTSNKFNYRGHVAGAVMSMVFSQIWIALNYPIALAAWAVYLVLTMYFTFRNLDKLLDFYEEETFEHFVESFLKTKPLFWVETTCIGIIFCSLFVLLQRLLIFEA